MSTPRKYKYKASIFEKKLIGKIEADTIIELHEKLAAKGVDITTFNLSRRFFYNKTPFSVGDADVSRRLIREEHEHAVELGEWLNTCSISVKDIAHDVDVSENTLYRAKMGKEGGGTVLSKKNINYLLPYAIANGYEKLE